MNKTLLLILCDFLLLNLLALTNWQSAEPPPRTRQEQTPPAINEDPAQNPSSREDDLVALMRIALTDEQQQRDQLAEQIRQKDSTLQQTAEQLQKTAEQLEQERQAAAARAAELARRAEELAKLNSTLSTEQQRAAEIARQKQAAEQKAQRAAALAKEQITQLRGDLARQSAEVQNKQEQIAELQTRQAAAAETIGKLNIAVNVAEREKTILRETTAQLETQIVAEREDRRAAQASATQLAQGVGQLAEGTQELRREIAENRPINANALYTSFLASRIQTRIHAVRPGPFGKRNSSALTIIATDGEANYALLHSSNTPFDITHTPMDWTRIIAEIARPDAETKIATDTLVYFSLDPRILGIPVSAELLAEFNVTAFKTALEPFKFPEAILINADGKGYGEVSFKLDPDNSKYLRMDTGVFKRLFGDFAPSRGDLVFSKTGELIGIMVNNTYCVLIDNFVPMQTINTGDKLPPNAAQFDALQRRLQRLPLHLQ